MDPGSKAGMTPERVAGCIKKLIPLASNTCILNIKLMHTGSWGNVPQSGVGWSGLL